MEKTNLIGQKFGRLHVLSLSRTDKHRNKHWLCQCDCGNTNEVSTASLRKGTKSCGCLQREVARDTQFKHGMEQSPEYSVWLNMRRRCNDESNISYNNYGGRGITVCKRWQNSFSNFYDDMGPRPEGMTLNRKRNNGNYTPSNCEWATDKQQANNKRNNITVKLRGKTMTLAQAATEYKTGHKIYSRYRAGYRGEDLICKALPRGPK